MKASLGINEGKYLCSFEGETEGLESIGKLISETIQKDNPFSLGDLFPHSELPEFNLLKMKFPKMEIKEKILLNVINEIEQDLNEEEKKIVLFEPSFEQNEKNDDVNKSTSINIFNTINKFVHKTLHGKKYLEENSCIFLEENGKNFEISEEYKNGEYDKNICNLKEKNKNFEFISIKSLMISITNYMKELIDGYITYYEKLAEKKIDEEKKIGIEGCTEVEENEEEILKLTNFDEIYNEIYKDFVSKSIICSELEENFKHSLDSFKSKYQMNFTLSELFSDIFWNSIFHNKILCRLFYDSYSSDDYGDTKMELRKIMKVIFDTNIPLKHHIVELLSLHQIEDNENKDLMTLIVDMKNKFHVEIVKSEKEKENLKQNQKMKELKEKEKNKIKEKEKEENIEVNGMNENNIDEDVNINNNKINEDNEFISDNKINLIKNKKEMKNDENIRCNIITANDISVIKNKKKKTPPSFLAVDTRNNNVILGVESTENKNEDKEKENNNSINDEGVPDLTHKTVDEIINYINDDRVVDKSTKGKRKKKSRKNKKAKKEEALAEQNKNQIEDSIVLKFKEDLINEFIHAGTITKIKPVISDNWIQRISSTY